MPRTQECCLVVKVLVCCGGMAALLHACHACASRSCLQSQSALLEDLRPACPRGPAAFLSSCACYLSHSFLSLCARIETLHQKNNCISEKLPSFSIGFAKSPQIRACLNITRFHQPKTQPKTYEKLEKLRKNLAGRYKKL